MHGFLTWAPQKPVFNWGGKATYCTGKNTGKHEKVLSGKQCFVKAKWMTNLSYVAN